MTRPDDDNVPESRQQRPGEEAFRRELLRDMSSGECLSLSDIDSIIQYDYRDEPLTSRQSRVMTTLSSLLTEGLAVVGEVVGGTDAYVDPWKMSTEDALAHLRELYVTNYENEVGWGWTTWFALTPEGKRVASECG